MNVKEVFLSPSLKDVSFVRDYRPGTYFLNPFNGNMIFNASTTVNVDENQLSYFWDFGDGTIGEGRVANHTYDSWPNNKKVTLRVYNGFYNTSIIKTIRRISSPNIYLYREIPCFDTIKVIVDGKVTKVIPEVPLGSEIIWEDVWVMGGKVFYQNKEYDFLYYEEEIDPIPSKYGWILERDRQGRYILNDNPTNIPSLKAFFSNELSKAGLFYNEIEDFIPIALEGIIDFKLNFIPTCI